ncbi:MAG: hypothetical protein HC778_08770 [Chamaesiphon sp. CSU_1_12]|nr:hypothetical protein [Chamaesiphon sp. CSU_1_12]
MPSNTFGRSVGFWHSIAYCHQPWLVENRSRRNRYDPYCLVLIIFCCSELAECGLNAIYRVFQQALNNLSGVMGDRNRE